MFFEFAHAQTSKNVVPNQSGAIRRLQNREWSKQCFQCSDALSLDACRSKCVSFVFRCPLQVKFALWVLNRSAIAFGRCIWARKWLDPDSLEAFKRGAGSARPSEARSLPREARPPPKAAGAGGAPEPREGRKRKLEATKRGATQLLRAKHGAAKRILGDGHADK